MTTLDSIENLRTVTSLPSATETYVVRGYAAPGDGGGGNFHWDATSTANDDGGIIIKANQFATGRWRRDYDPATGPVDLRWFGITYGTTASAADNYTRLIALINQGRKVLVKDALYVEVKSFADAITADTIKISGDSAASRVIFMNTGTLLNIPARLREFTLSNISLSSSSRDAKNPVKIFWEDKKACFIEKLQITGCKFTGTITLRLYGAGFALGTAGLGTGLISNNEIRDLYGSWMTLVDCVYDEVTIRDNQLYEIHENVFNDGITNNLPFPKPEEIRLNKKQLNVQHNTLINAPATFKASGENTYYLFILTESNSCLYEYNHVEGIKATYSVAIYDIYMSSETGIYRNNVYKNNLSFGLAINDGSKALFKGKAGSSKIVENNRFIIEETFVTGFLNDHSGLNPDNTWVSYASFDTEAVKNSKVYFTGNEVDVYYLRNIALVNKEFLHYEVRNNTFRFARVEGPFVVADNSTFSTPKQVRNFIFEGNTVTRYGNTPSGQVYIIQGKSSPGALDPTKDEMRLSVQNNTLTGWSGAVLTTIAADSLVLYNNAIDASLKGTSSTAFCNGVYLDNITGSLSSFKTKDYTPSDLRTDTYFKTSDVAFTFDMTNGMLTPSTGMSMMPVPYNKTYYRRFELTSATLGTLVFEYTIKGTREPGTVNNYLEYHDFTDGKDYKVQMGNPTVLKDGKVAQTVMSVKAPDNTEIGTLVLNAIRNTVVLSFVLKPAGNYLLKIRQKDTLLP
ncbi:MAG TPA: hypothetical protein VM802_05245 [Chitinophaga sp.]|uniref:hypothetical protein n=1 Tax=Chitinophaga sp. TaxID=1869181 RepID=UPI002C8C40A5|nr:hypothetical protein [Chitinophaga sp.]HVI44248.1 hypothetical protein [Chitinophaga sp.]